MTTEIIVNIGSNNDLLPYITNIDFSSTGFFVIHDIACFRALQVISFHNGNI